jgi:hypothetical protein
MPIQVRGVLVRAMSGTELSRVRTEFRLRRPEPINKSPPASRRPTLLCNQPEKWISAFAAGSPSIQTRNDQPQTVE